MNRIMCAIQFYIYIYCIKLNNEGSYILYTHIFALDKGSWIMIIIIVVYKVLVTIILLRMTSTIHGS